jgi:hypothetical protein
MSSSERNNSTSGSGMTIDIRPMIEDVSQVMTKHITSILSGVIGEYTIYKETHDTIMGLPCVRKLQERISELEQDGSGCASACAASASRSGSREEEVAQLQSAIEDLNRYIHALESKVNMKQPVSCGDGGHNQQHHHQDEESVRLEIHETDDGDGDGDGDEGEGGEDHCESTVETSSTHKNVIITTEALEETEDAEEAEAQEEDADAEEAEEAEADAEAAEEAEADAEAAEEAEADAEAEEAEEEEAEADAEAEDAEADAEAEAEADAEEAEAEAEADAEAEAEDAEAQPEPEPEAEEETEEVEEVKIKGKTYFTTNPQNGIIYACVDDDVGDEVGVFKNGVAVFNKGKK